MSASFAPVVRNPARRIVHVAAFGYQARKGAYLHNVATKLSNGWIRDGHHVINFSARDVSRWAAPFQNRWLGARRVNRLLLDLCAGVQPQVLVLGHADIITPETVEAIRDRLPDLKVLQWNVDWLLPPDYRDHIETSGDQNLERLLARAHVVDATFVSTAGPALEHLAGLTGGVTGFMPNPVDASIETARAFEADWSPADLFFAGSSRDPRRFVGGEAVDVGELLSELSRRDPGLRIEAHGVGGAPPVFGPAYQTAMARCRIGLNLSRHNDVYLYSSDRLAQMAGNGLAIVMDRASGYGDLFGDDAFAFYSGADELFETVSSLARDRRRRRAVAELGCRRYHSLFDCRIVARYLLDVVEERHDPARYAWPTLVDTRPGTARLSQAERARRDTAQALTAAGLRTSEAELMH